MSETDGIDVGRPKLPSFTTRHKAALSALLDEIFAAIQKYDKAMFSQMAARDEANIAVVAAKIDSAFEAMRRGELPEKFLHNMQNKDPTTH
jgi:hypothetical protein